MVTVGGSSSVGVLGVSRSCSSVSSGYSDYELALSSAEVVDSAARIGRSRSYTAESVDTELDSFVSALDLADLSDLDSHARMFEHLTLYMSGLNELQRHGINCRTLRTQLVGCASDVEFFVKLHCLRLAFNVVLADADFELKMRVAGKRIFCGLLVLAEQDFHEFAVAYDCLFQFVRNPDNWHTIADELHDRGVCHMNFYDIALDFVLMDAFEDLESPPSSLVAAIGNRWLSDSIKQRAVSAAVWSVLKAKRSLLRVPDGFIGHYYRVSEFLSPALAWGFLGPDSPLKTVCGQLKTAVMEFIRSLFNFEHARFTSLDQLVVDVRTLSTRCVETLLNGLDEALALRSTSIADLAISP